MNPTVQQLQSSSGMQLGTSGGMSISTTNGPNGSLPVQSGTTNATSTHRTQTETPSRTGSSVISEGNGAAKKIVPFEAFEDEKDDDDEPPEQPFSFLSYFGSIFANPLPSHCSYKRLANACGYRAKIDNLKKWADIRRLDPNCLVYRDIQEYLDNSSSTKLRIDTIYKVDRKDESRKFSQDPYRILLWHGTHSGAIPGIIENGFRKGWSGMYGSGCYFADRIAKSQPFGRISLINGNLFFVLAEVSPGKVYKAHKTHMDYTTAPVGFDTVKGMGRLIPDWDKNKRLYGAILPCGKTVNNQRHPNYFLAYNEYNIYDVERIKVRFILQCKQQGFVNTNA